MIHFSNADNSNKYLTNVDFLGLGYDIFVGNPHKDIFDEGFRSAVIQLTYSPTQPMYSSDFKWTIPENTQALQVISFSSQTDSTEITGMTSYQKSLELEARLTYRDDDKKFSASAEYQLVQDGITNYHYYYVEAVAKCSVYKLKVTDIQSIKLTKSFQDAVTNLPTSPNESYIEFIGNYGTHFATELIMGAKTVIQSEFEEKSWAEMQNSDIDVNFEAGLNNQWNSAVGSQATVAGEELFTCLRRNYKQSYLGSLPPRDGNYSSWALSVGESPYPIYRIHSGSTDCLVQHKVNSWKLTK